MSRAPLLHVVLCEPEIPNNTGNIGRTCVALGCALHLVHPLGFELSEKACRRAGLDYWPRLEVREHRSIEEYLRAESPGRMWVLTTRARRPAWDADLRPGDHLLFGPETRGLAPPILERFRERTLTLPMLPGERSLNLATAVCAVVYEAVRQMIGRGDLLIDHEGRLRRPGNGAG